MSNAKFVILRVDGNTSRVLTDRQACVTPEAERKAARGWEDY